MKAYELHIKGFGEMRCILAAKNRNHARIWHFHDAKDAGYDEIRYIDVSAKRAPDFDGEAAKHAGKSGAILLGWEHGKPGTKSAERWGVLAAQDVHS